MMIKRYKYLFSLIFVVVLVLLITFFVRAQINFKTSITEITLEVGEQIEYPEVKATFNGNDVSQEVQIIDNIDYQKAQTTTLKFKYQWFIFSKTFSIPVTLEDTTAPKFNYTGSKVLVVAQNSEPLNFDFQLTDNSSDEIQLTTLDQVDYSKEGYYFIHHSIQDQSENTNSLLIEVKVEANAEHIDFSSKNYESPKLLHPGAKVSKPLLDNQFYEYTFIGDSIIRDFGYKSLIAPERVIARPCLAPTTFDQPCTYQNDEAGFITYNLIYENNFTYLVLNMGLCDIETGTLEQFLVNYEDVLNKISYYAPNSKIIVASVLPVVADNMEFKPSNATINTFNYYLAKMCDRMWIPYIDVASALKDEQGLGNAEYYEQDGYHLNDLGEQVYLTYMKENLVE